MRSAMFMCEVQMEAGNNATAPGYISFSHDPQASFSNGTLIVENIHNRKQSLKYVVCIHGPLQRYKDYIRLVEHVEVHKIFGADFYSIYNITASPVLNPYIKYYKGRGQMEVHQWHIPPIPTHDGGQLALINDCLYRYMYRTKYIAMMDMDEFIVPTEHLTWNDMFNISQCGNHAEAIFRHTFFNVTDSDDKAYMSLKSFMSGSMGNKTKLTNDSGENSNLVTLHKTNRQREADGCFIRSKVIIKPELIKLATVHYVDKPREHCCVETHLGLLHHYRGWLPPNVLMNKTRDRRMHKFADKILYSVENIFNVVRTAS